MRSIESIKPTQIGNRLRLARENAGLTQEQASSHIGIARTTVVAIEKGERKIRYEELNVLANLYKVSVNLLLRHEAIHVDLEPRFRKLEGASSKAGLAATQLLVSLAKAEVELESLLGIERIANYPPERPILPGDIRGQAEQDSIEFRHRLGLGISPIPDFIMTLELDLNVRVYVRPIDSKISGLFAFDETVGACMLLNANHPFERQVQTAAHECGHFVSNRHQPEILTDEAGENSKEERYASLFGRALLLPARGLKERFLDVVAGSDHFTRRHIIILAHYFQVSREALVRRLEELQIVKPGTWDWFSATGGISNEQAKQVLGDRDNSESVRSPRLLQSIRLNLLASAAYRRGLLSEGQLSELLNVDRVALRTMLDDYEFQEKEAMLLGKRRH